jgi:hypothetical protein
MAIKRPKGHLICQHIPSQRPPKIYPNWYLWFENKPSGNPGEIRDVICPVPQWHNCLVLLRNVGSRNAEKKSENVEFFHPIVLYY